MGWFLALILVLIVIISGGTTPDDPDSPYTRLDDDEDYW